VTKLVLFDIDGTLLSGDGAARRAFEASLAEVFGTPGDPSVRYDGKTDRQIARELMRGAGFDDAEVDRRWTPSWPATWSGCAARCAPGARPGRPTSPPSLASPRCSTRSSRCRA
jgi:FMN phosphatase YigB (HAD superfamily)